MAGFKNLPKYVSECWESRLSGFQIFVGEYASRPPTRVCCFATYLAYSVPPTHEDKI